MTRQECTAKALEWLENHGVDLTADNYSWYGPYCEVVSRYVNGKLSIGDILSATDKLNDLLTKGLPGFCEVPLAKKDRIQGQIRAMEFLPETKGVLTRDEKEAFAFCVYYHTCVRVFDEKLQTVTMPIHDFESFEKIDAEYHDMKDPSGVHADMFVSAETPKEGRFGYSPGNPICVASVPEEYAYIKALRRADRVPRSFNRIGSVEGTNGHILDKWEVAYGGKKGFLYFDAYAESNSDALGGECKRKVCDDARRERESSKGL